jgi:AcrR family transcriptional regulator
MARGRPLDPQVSDAVLDAALTLLARGGFARMTTRRSASSAIERSIAFKANRLVWPASW